MMIIIIHRGVIIHLHNTPVICKLEMEQNSYDEIKYIIKIKNKK